TAPLFDDARVPQRDRRMGRESFERGLVLGVERTQIQTADSDRRRELAVHEDRYADQRADSDIADRGDRSRVLRVILNGDGRAAAQHGPDDADLRRGVDPDDSLAGARTGRDVELLASTKVDRGVVGVG